MANRRSGMSMVEIMIGVILLSLIVVPSLNVIVSQTQTVTATRDHSAAAFVAQKVQELCRSHSFDLIEADQYSADPATQKKTFEWRLKNDDEYRRHLINGIEYLVDPEKTFVTPVPDQFASGNPAPSVYLVKFSISYKSKDKRSHRLDISTAIAQRE